MGQVIEVRFINPNNNNEVLADEIVAVSIAKYNANDHTNQHEEVIKLALKMWSAGTGVAKSITRDPAMNGQRSAWSGAESWMYGYFVMLEDEEYDRAMYALLFAQYKEKQELQEAVEAE